MAGTKTTRVLGGNTLAMHPKFHVLCGREDIDYFTQQTPIPFSPMHVRDSSMTILEASGNLPSIAEVMSRSPPDTPESRQRAQSTITLLEGAAEGAGLVAHGMRPSVVIPLLPRPPRLPASIESITGRPSVQDEDDPDTFEVANDPEGDEDLADDINVNEFDAADDLDYDSVQRTRDARRTIAARNKKDKTCGCYTDKIEARILNQIKRDKKLTAAQLMTLMREFYNATSQSRSALITRAISSGRDL